MKATHTFGHQAAGMYHPASTRYGSLPDTSTGTTDMCSSKVDGDRFESAECALVLQRLAVMLPWPPSCVRIPWRPKMEIPAVG